ncbi:MAG: glycosyltransferase family 39 protein [Anaerolineales bacterium]|nr:glycosyltransferase family 39 protein [Anaerolineales bacterium]
MDFANESQPPLDLESENRPSEAPKPVSRVGAFFQRLKQRDLAFWLFLLALGLYLATRLIGLTHFPIYFFTDEAIQTQSMADLIANHYKDIQDVLFPSYFRNGEYANLSLSVYLQWLPLLIFGKSALVTRGTSVLITCIAALSVGLILRDIFQNKYWWAGTLFLSITPAWFLHSRTAFETAEFTAFYAGTLYFYLLYRYKSPKYIYLTFVFAAFAFYSYNPGQLIVPITALAFLISDWRYHWENRNTTLKGLPILLVMVIPYLRYRMEYPGAAYAHLHIIGSYLVEPISLLEKIQRYFSEYGFGLSPEYWYTPNNRDLPRHLMKNYGQILIATLPFTILGLAKILANLRESSNRNLLLTLLIMPVSSALIAISITRVLAFVVPAAILTAIGAERFLNWIQNPWPSASAENEKPTFSGKRIIFSLLILGLGGFAAFLAKQPVNQISLLALIFILLVQNWADFWSYFLNRKNASNRPRTGFISQTVLALTLFASLAGVNSYLLYDALKNGPLWYQDYGMGGLQYGAFQIFDAIKDYQRKHPTAQIIFSPNWANGTNIVAQFFYKDLPPFEIASVAGHITAKLPLDENTVFVMIPEEYAAAAEEPKFSDVHVEKIVSYPNGLPGFYFVRLKYSPQADELFAAEKAFRAALRESFVKIDGQAVKVRHSYLDAGDQEEAQSEAIKLLFDGDELSLAKTYEANPFVVELTFPTPRTVNGFSIVIGSAQAQITLKCYADENSQPVIYTFTGQGSIQQPKLSFDLPTATTVKKLTIEMFDPKTPSPTKVHIWEIKLR